MQVILIVEAQKSIADFGIPELKAASGFRTANLNVERTNRLGNGAGAAHGTINTYLVTPFRRSVHRLASGSNWRKLCRWTNFAKGCSLKKLSIIAYRSKFGLSVRSQTTHGNGEHALTRSMKRTINSLNSATSEAGGVEIKRLEAGMGDWRAYEEFARTVVRVVGWIVAGIVGI